MSAATVVHLNLHFHENQFFTIDFHKRRFKIVLGIKLLESPILVHFEDLESCLFTNYNNLSMVDFGQKSK